MDSDKVNIVDCTATNLELTIGKDTEDENGETPMRCRKRKFLVISVVVLIFAVLLFVAVVVFFSLGATKIRIQEKNHQQVGSRNIDQELYQDTTDSLTIYHVQDGQIDTWVILDYNRELEIMKASVGGTSTCYVSPATTDNVQEKNVTDPMENSLDNVAENSTLPVVNRRSSSRSIKEKSILGKRGQELCQDIDTFWVISSCNPQSSIPDNRRRNSRVRRAVYTFYSCYWDWTRCYFVKYDDSPYYIYYTCAWTCGQRTYNY